MCMSDRCLLCAPWQTEAQIKDRETCKLLPQIKHLGVFAVIQVHTHRDPFTVSLIFRQTETLTTITVARIAAHRVHTCIVAHVPLTLVHICNTREKKLVMVWSLVRCKIAFAVIPRVLKF